MNSADYPRWMFHRHHDMVLVQNEEEEAALGAGWSRIIQPREDPLTAQEPPAATDEPEQRPKARKRT